MAAFDDPKVKQFVKLIVGGNPGTWEVMHDYLIETLPSGADLEAEESDLRRRIIRDLPRNYDLSQLLREWRKARAVPAWEALQAWLRANLPKDFPFDSIEARLQTRVDQDIRREQMELVVHEAGNLETEPWRVQSLTTEAPPTEWVSVKRIHEGERMELDIQVAVNAEHQPEITEVKYRDHQVEPERPTWVGGWKRVHGREAEHLLNALHIPDGPILKEAMKIAEKKLAPYVGTDGVLWYPRGEIHNAWLVLDGPPEYMERELNRRFGYGAKFITLYTDGGGVGNDMPEAVLVFDDNDANEELYELIEQSAHGAETECPFINADSDYRESGNTVTEEDTLYGEEPLTSCRFCQATIGEEHGYVYVGEGGEYVYVLVDDEDEEG